MFAIEKYTRIKMNMLDMLVTTGILNRALQWIKLKMGF